MDNDVLSDLEKYKKYFEILTNRCAAMTKGTLCGFCNISEDCKAFEPRKTAISIEPDKKVRDHKYMR